MKSRRMPLWLGWTLALLAAAGFARLGVWQLARMHEKEAMLASVQATLAQRIPQPLAGQLDSTAGYAWVEGSGQFEAAPRLLLDNQSRGDRAGVKVYCLFAPDGGNRTLLIELGWLPLNGSREMPTMTCPSGNARIRGLLMPPPSPGLKLGPAQTRIDTKTWLATRIEPAQLGALWRVVDTPSPRVLRLDPAMKGIGYARDLDVLPNTLPPSRHLGYAVQWFALAAAVLITAAVLTFRKPRA